MPYKQIAAQLKKTELACRLHYHQLAHGSHRRRRTSSVCSTASQRSGDVPLSMSRYHVNHEYAPITPAHSPRLGSPINSLRGASPANRFSAVNNSPGQGHSSKMLLPKPHLLKQASARAATPDLINGPLRINTADAILAGRSQSVPPLKGKMINMEKLRAAYEVRRQAFWSEVAADYGGDVSPAHLEHVWRYGLHMSRPPTPDESPDSGASVTSAPSMSKPYSGNRYHSDANSAGKTSPPRLELPRLLPHDHRNDVSSQERQQHQQRKGPQPGMARQQPLPGCSNSAIDRAQQKSFSPVSNIASAVSAPDRTPYVLPASNLVPRSWASSTTPPLQHQQQQQRSGTSTPQAGLPATSISALLNQEKWPAREASAEPVAVA